MDPLFLQQRDYVKWCTRTSNLMALVDCGLWVRATSLASCLGLGNLPAPEAVIKVYWGRCLSSYSPTLSFCKARICIFCIKWLLCYEVLSLNSKGGFERGLQVSCESGTLLPGLRQVLGHITWKAAQHWKDCRLLWGRMVIPCSLCYGRNVVPSLGSCTCA